jgi:hypothetical protein
VPRRIRGLNAMRLLAKAGVLLICAGGGGIPVTVTAEGGVRGVEAVIDKNLTAALLAEQLAADALLLLTDVSAVLSKWPTSPESQPIDRTTPAELRARISSGLNGAEGRSGLSVRREDRAVSPQSEQWKRRKRSSMAGQERSWRRNRVGVGGLVPSARLHRCTKSAVGKRHCRSPWKVGILPALFQHQTSIGADSFVDVIEGRAPRAATIFD